MLDKEAIEKVEKALTLCGSSSMLTDKCVDCPYDWRNTGVKAFKCNEMAVDAMAYINQLKSEKENLFSKVANLTFALDCKSDEMHEKGQKAVHDRKYVRKVTLEQVYEWLVKFSSTNDAGILLVLCQQFYNEFLSSKGVDIKSATSSPLTWDELCSFGKGDIVWVVTGECGRYCEPVEPLRDGMFSCRELYGENVGKCLMLSKRLYGKKYVCYKSKESAER